MLAGAAARFRESFPAVELCIESATRAERFLELAAGIVAWRILEGRAHPGDLACCPWIDFDWPAPRGKISSVYLKAPGSPCHLS